jgi:hypothetical protein
LFSVSDRSSASPFNCPGFHLTVNDGGRLGNMMGEYATLYAHAKRIGVEPRITWKMSYQLRTVFRYIELTLSIGLY